MATLNTLRTRFGFVLTGVIALVLLAFIFSPSDLINFAGNDPIVAKINGHNVTYTEYAREYDEIQSQSGVSTFDDAQVDMLYQSTWQSLITSYVVTPGLVEMGFAFGPAEYAAVLRGSLPTQTMYSAFGNPQTGAYDVNAVNNFVLTSRGNAEAEAAWASLMDQVEEERLTTKYLAMVAAGINTNSLEAKLTADGNNKDYTGRWAYKRYADIEDSWAKVTDAEIKALYDARKELFKREPSRNVSYVLFNVEPSSADKSAIEAKAKALAQEFESVELSDIPTFVRESRSGSVATNYVTADQLPTMESTALTTGEMYGPTVTADNAWRISRVVESIYASDTLSLRHIVLPYTEEKLADSLLIALQGGADFALAAMNHSAYSETAQLGGEVGAVPFSSFEGEFSKALAPARKGDIVKVASGDMIQLLQVYDASARKRHYKVATIDLPIVPSQETRTAAHSAAGEYAMDLTGHVDDILTLSSEASVSPFNALLVPSTRTIDAVDGSSNVVRWAHKAKVGDVSEIFTVESGYVVAAVTSINNDKYESYDVAAVRLTQELMNAKKFEAVAAQISGSTFDEMVASISASTGSFEDINYNSYYIPGLGIEHEVVGAIISSNEGDVSSPIKGQYGLYFFETMSMESDDTVTAEAEKARLEALAIQSAQQRLFDVLTSLSEIEDLRGSVL